MELAKCPNCGKEMETIESSGVHAEERYYFSKEKGKYIRWIAVIDAELLCPYCDEVISWEWLKKYVDENLLTVDPSGLYKAFTVDLTTLPFDIKYIEYSDKLPDTI